MAWKVEISSLAQKHLKKLDPQTRRRVLSFLFERAAKLDDPRSIGEALIGAELGAFWRYRVGDYRIVAEIEDGALRILVVKVGNRKEIYR